MGATAGAAAVVAVAVVCRSSVPLPPPLGAIRAGAWVILVPAVGGIGVTFIIANFAPEAKGHGVPEVMDAIYYNGGRIRPMSRSPSRWPRRLRSAVAPRSAAKGRSSRLGRPWARRWGS
jgi:H+/Cl- antiporter ClcA